MVDVLSVTGVGRAALLVAKAPQAADGRPGRVYQYVRFRVRPFQYLLGSWLRSGRRRLWRVRDGFRRSIHSVCCTARPLAIAAHARCGYLICESTLPAGETDAASWRPESIFDRRYANADMRTSVESDLLVKLGICMKCID